MVLLLVAGNAWGMERWAALSQLESGDDDKAVGPSVEVSRYQIQPDLWNSGEPTDAQAALENAKHIMSDRLTAFQKQHNREATDFEFYVLWNAPGQIDKPSKVVKDRADRFANLCKRQEIALNK